MALVQVDGLSGTGKTTLVGEFRRRRLVAVDSDLAFAHFADPVTGAPTGEEIRANWAWRQHEVERFAEEHAEDLAFVCGGACNDDDFAGLFVRRFALVIDDATMVHRLTTRTNNDYASSGPELAEQLELNRTAAADARARGFVVIDATRSPAQVADEIIRRTSEASGTSLG